jgi:hypothetical protein
MLGRSGSSCRPLLGLFLGCWIAVFLSPSAAQTRSAGSGQATPAGPVEILRILIVNDQDGAISVSRNEGRTWTQVGRVLRYTTQVTRQGYTASKWVPAGQVAATAVNAIHVNVGYNARDDRGVVFSLLPREMLAAPPTYSSFLSPDSSIHTDIAAGTSIFGGGEAPFVGSRLFLERSGDGSGQGDRLCSVEAGYVPAQGDVLVIVVALPDHYPTQAVFENWAGGGVWMLYGDGSRQQLGWVIRPVRGIGRFLGGVYASVGRIRANHAGVVDVSTSPLGQLGGFQIIPVGHALSPEMGNAWKLTQWMVVGPLREGDALWDGLMPLFSQHLRPDYLPGDLQGRDWRERLLARFLVEVDLGAGWRPSPALHLSPDPAVPLPDWANNALAQVRRIRILFPLGLARAVAQELGARADANPGH